MYDGNLKLILGLIWTLIQHFHIRSSAHSINDKSDSIKSDSVKSRLLAWINAQIPNQKIKNFTTDWNDGVALCALVEHIKPGLCPNHANLDREQKFKNCSSGIKLAEEELGVVRIIEPDDLLDPNVDSCSVMTYISSFCKPANECLLKWVQRILPDRNITNLSSDWQNGVNLACLLNALVPDLFPNWQKLDTKNARDNLTKAMEIGEKHFGIEPVVTPSQQADGDVDELGLSTYLTQLQRYARSDKPPIQKKPSRMNYYMIILVILLMLLLLSVIVIFFTDPEVREL